jgi:HemY protein
MRAALWLVSLFAVAVATALLASNNVGTVAIFWTPYRVDLSLNLVLFGLVMILLTLHWAQRALTALFELPRQAKRWRLQQKERAAHGALLDAMAQFMVVKYWSMQAPCVVSLTSWRLSLPMHCMTKPHVSPIWTRPCKSQLAALPICVNR